MGIVSVEMRGYSLLAFSSTIAGRLIAWFRTVGFLHVTATNLPDKPRSILSY